MNPAAVRDYWLHPGPENTPEAYLAASPERSDFLVDLVARHVPRGARILELGCNAGRNLAALRRAGYRKVAGIEINRQAAKMSGAILGPIEDVLPTLAADSADLIFTMAVLEHLPPESEPVFAEMVRVARRWIVTVEDEHRANDRTMPRDYGAIFAALGMRQVEAVVPEGLGFEFDDFMARVFVQ